MAFNFNKAVSDAQKDMDNKSLFLILLGSSGNGKSTSLGTLPGKILYLYTSGESHGPKAASITGDDRVVPVCIDRDGDSDLKADDAMKRLHTILDDVEGIKAAGFDSLALDGATELEALIRNTTKFKVSTTTDSGKHNGFAEGPATIGQFREVVNKLKNLHRKLGIHVVTTCALVVKEYDDEGTIMDCQPQLQGYSVVSNLIQQFDDVLITGKMQKGDKISYRFQLLASGSKKSVDVATQAVKKTFNFSPRVTGVDILALPATLKADFTALAQIKQDGGVKK